MKKPILVFFTMLAIIVIILSLWFVNSIFGNPISKFYAKKSAQNYIEENYRDRDFYIDTVFYNFKSGYYEADVKSESSIDTHFIVSVRFNTVAYDSYEDDVVSGWNTYERIESEYRELVDDVFTREDFPLISEIDFGTIELDSEAYEPNLDEADYGIKLTELELDKQYDIKEIAKTAGHIVYYAQDDDVSFERAAELLLILKNELDEADLPFHAVSFVLEKPRTEERASEDENSIHTAHLLYHDIYEEGLVERIQEAHESLMYYYEEQDETYKKD